MVDEHEAVRQVDEQVGAASGHLAARLRVHGPLEARLALREARGDGPLQVGLLGHLQRAPRHDKAHEVGVPWRDVAVPSQAAPGLVGMPSCRRIVLEAG